MMRREALEGQSVPEVLRPDGATLYYEVTGEGDPVLALAPGGVSSGLGRWAHSPLDSLSALHSRCTVVAMDQRHAGLSRSNLTPFSYDDALGDQLAVLDAAGVRQANVLGVGIGAAYALKLAYDAPARVNAVALVWPIGLDGNNKIGDYYAVFKDTIRTARAEGLAAVIEAAQANACFVENPAAGPWSQQLHDDAAFRAMLQDLSREYYISQVVDFRDGMFPWGRRYFSVNDVAVERLRAPLLVVPGIDGLHTAALAESLCERARQAELTDSSLLGEPLAARICEFFARHPFLESAG